MRRLVISAVILAVVIALAAPADASDRRHRYHHHHTGADIALGLATFAVANQLLAGPFLYDRRGVVIYEQVYAPPPVVYYAPPLVLAPPQPVFYPHGRYEFMGQRWVWIPNAPPPPPSVEPCVPTGELAKTPLGYVAVCR